MRITKKNVGRLASLSALGAGALGVASGTAEAGTIHYTPLNSQVGFSSGFGFSFQTNIVPGVTVVVRRSTAGGTLVGGVPNYWGFVGLHGGVTTSVSTASGYIRLKAQNANAGQKWNDLNKTVATHLLLGQRSGFGSTASTKGVNGNFFKLFEFQTSGSAPIEYGWIDFQQSITPTSGPDVTILGLAYDSSGAQIAAGDTGNTGVVPEPGTAALASLGALALGARGLRRWRQTRNQAA